MHLGELLKWPLMSVTSLLGHSAVPPPECSVKFMAVQMATGGRGQLFSNEGHVAALWGPVEPVSAFV